MSKTATPAHVAHRIAESVSKDLGHHIEVTLVERVLNGEVSRRSFLISNKAYDLIAAEANDYGIRVPR